MRDGAAIVSALGGRRISNGWKFRCPAHEDPAPSCVLRDDGLVTCFAGCERRVVWARLDALGFPDDGRGPRTTSPEDLRKYREEGTREAQRLWADAMDRPSDREVVEYYLRNHRKITLPPPYHVMRRDGTSGVVVALQQLDGEITGVQFRSPGRRGITKGWLGTGAVMLAPPRDGEVGVAEGFETAMAATQLTGVPCWAALGARRMFEIEFPKEVKNVTIFGENDETGQEQFERAKNVYLERELVVREWFPPEEYKDFNDILMGRKKL